jgi:hypothetical protein
VLKHGFKSVFNYYGLCRDAVVQLFEAWMPSFAPQMVLLTFVVTKVRPAAGKAR